MSLTQTHACFEDTSYTLVNALHDERTAAFAASEIARRYWPPVYAYLRKSGKNRDEAAELTQAFFVDKVHAGKLFEQADRSKGRLRNLILHALKNYLVDVHRKELTRGKGKLVPIDKTAAEELYATDCTLYRDPSDAFNKRWSNDQIAEAMRRCEKHFKSTGRDKQWEAFTDRVYHPSIYQSSATPYKDLAPKLGFHQPGDVGAAVQNAKEKVLATLREVISESCSRTDDADAEIKLIMRMYQSQ